LKVLLVGLNAKYIHSSLALYTIGASCQAAGHPVEIAEYTINQELLHVLGDVASYQPEVVGIACYIWNREMTLKLTAALKKVLPAVRIVLGGPEASGDAAAILRQNLSVDFVVQGEGEESLPELLTELAQAGAGRKVAGIAVRCGEGVELNGGVRVVEKLDDLPFPYQEAQMAGLANRIIYYESSRGCPFSCSYCVSSLTRGVRTRSVEKVKAELRFFIKHGVKQVKFVDRTFNVRLEHYREIWRFLAAADTTANFHFEIVADLLNSEEIQWLSQVDPGRFQFEIGVQTLCEPALTAIGRRNDWARLSDNVRNLRQGGNIHLHLDLIVGLPHEDLNSFRNSFNAVYSLQPDMLQIGFLKLLPGTRIRREAAEYDYVCLDHAPYEILSNRWLVYRDIRRLKQLEEVFEQTYNSGRFSRTLGFLIRFCADGDAFTFYQELTAWWEQQEMIGRAHSPEGVLAALRNYADRLPTEQKHRVRDLLKFETLLDGSGSLKGNELDWNAERWERQKAELWRNEEKLRHYIPDYRFSNWREVKRIYPVEIFDTDVSEWADGGKWPKRQVTAMVFDRTSRPVWRRLEWNDVAAEEEA
jgi:radical SAM superfamily enzyme YgiQ (UPF0313 family)